MQVFINAATGKWAEKAEFVSTTILGQTLQLPYFKAFQPPLLPLDMLYAEIHRQIENALAQANWQFDELRQIPIFIGSTAYTISDYEYRTATQSPLPTEYSLAVIADELRHRYQTQVFSLATSCTSSAQGIQYAYRMIAQQRCEKALVIGFETFNQLTFAHFHSMHLLATDTPYLPLLKSDGLVLGEGVACVALSHRPNPAFNAEIMAVTSLTDNQNLTNNSETALRNLLQTSLKFFQKNTALGGEQIQAVKLHGVGGNADEMEKQVLADLLPNSKWILTKPYSGHTLGASGAMETAFLLQQLQMGQLMPLPENPQSNLPLAHGNTLNSGYYLNYFLGFGGSNVAWILKWGKNSEKFTRPSKPLFRQKCGR